MHEGPGSARMTLAAVRAEAAGAAGAAASPTDDEVVHRVLAGETRVYAVLVERYQRDVWRVAVQLGGDRLATEGVVQQTLVLAYEHLDQYETGRDFGRWLRAIARNVVKQELRKLSRETRRLSVYRDYLCALYESEDGASERQAQIERALDACVAALAPAAARAVRLRYDDALGVEEVAAAIGRTLGATRQLLWKARERIRACVERRLAAE
jgi:RNA polymerase sigma-70 factor (ECF subfamily)